MAKNPYTKLLGYVAASNEYPNGWLVVFDRREIEPYSHDRIVNRWLVKHMESGETKAYPTKDAATFEAYRCARSVQSHDWWWNDGP
ncbi:hypothetical protein LJR251_001631 [Rhizobium rhizogenes]|uniref:hypothetical protein n=1 Tax=Rhizobium rhizogenes TaxID=359 RepID=UPI003ED0E3CB